MPSSPSSVIWALTDSFLKVHYVGSEQPAVKRGGSAVDHHEIVLNEDEWITGIECTVASADIESIKFVNNKGSRFKGEIMGLRRYD